ncbi:hypothetical protein ABKV19_023781 [Rosa sericea]
MSYTILYFTLLFIFLLLPTCFSLDTITPNQPIIDDGVALLSSQKKFALGFFSPGNSRKRYIGVWYNNIPNRTVVWVANRDNPVNDINGLLAIHESGGLRIYGQDRTLPLWSANVTLSSLNSSMAKLLDTGNLVLLENGSQMVLWQSFDHLSHTVLPSMKLGVDRRSGFNWFLTSWKSQDDPGTGNCTYGINPSGFPQFTLYKGTTLVHRFGIGSWGVQFNNVITYVNNQDEVTVTDVQTELITRTVLDDSGILLRSTWNERAYEWTTYQSVPEEACDEYGTCGPNGNCNPYSSMSKIDCTCLPGFEPKSPTDWNKTIWSGGCVKKNRTSMCRKGEGFVKMEMIKLPESSRAQVNVNVTLKECEHECLRNCSCTAYCNVVDGETSRCVTWYGDLMDAKTLPANVQNLYVRVDATVFGT